MKSSADSSDTFSVKKVAAFKQTQKPASNANQVTLNCPESILIEFRKLLKDTKILGSTYINPYNNQPEKIPNNVNDLTAVHLQILARNEYMNTNGVMNVNLYNGKLNDDQIARLRCLVKATNVAGVVDAHSKGGYPPGKPIFAVSQQSIVIDQSGLQWQGDFRNTGGMFFYPTADPNKRLPADYAKWQSDMHKVMYGKPRPDTTPSHNNMMDVKWNGVQGKIDLNQVRDAIATEFSQALDAAVFQGNKELNQDAKINFKFLKAGMGFFADGLKNRSPDNLEHTRLLAIQQALERIANLPDNERKTALGKVSRIELPFSGSNNPADIQVIAQIKNLVENKLHLEWGGTPLEDVFEPRAGFVNATTNCGDPHAMIGNEGNHHSVDAAISTNAAVDHLNAGFNGNNMQLRKSPDFAPHSPNPAPTQNIEQPYQAPEQPEVDFLVTPAMAKALYEAVIYLGRGSELQNLSNDPKPDKFNKALEILDVKPDAVYFNGNNGYIIKVNADILSDIQDIIEFSSEKASEAKNASLAAQNQMKQEQSSPSLTKDFIVTREMAKAIYERVVAKGEGKKLENLQNTQSPEKFKMALKILGMEPDETTFNGMNGYKIKVTEHNFHRLETLCIAQKSASKEHILLPEKVAAIYKAVTAMGKEHELGTLSNSVTPAKFNKALEILGIKPDAVGFNGNNGYKITINAENLDKIENVIAATKMSSNIRP